MKVYLLHFNTQFMKPPPLILLFTFSKRQQPKPLDSEFAETEAVITD